MLGIANDKDDISPLNSILGALPFLVIAVIEPTKIPLAGDSTRPNLGWKILILVTLLGLTGVTFETMFNGLERNLTSAKKVVDAENDIVLSDQVAKRIENMKLMRYQNNQ